MKIIRSHVNEIIFSQYFKQQSADQVKLSRYTYCCKVKRDTIVCFSFVSDAIVILNDEEYRCVCDMNFGCNQLLFRVLQDSGFFVDKNADEYQFMAEHRKNIFRLSSKTVKFVILPTTFCNAGCRYCIGENNPMMNMTDETAMAAIDFIVNKASTYENIKFDWYGGEPLLRRDLISYICNEVSRRLPTCKFSSVITTNLALFDDDVLESAIREWHVRKVNVTLDGTEEEHNARKNYCNKQLNGYQHTLRCIKSLVEHGITVFCRFNIDRDNYGSLETILDDLKPLIGDKNLYFFVSPLRGDNDHREFYAVSEYNNLLYNTGVLLNKHGIHNSIDSFVPRLAMGVCLAKSENCIVIAPDGVIYRCNLDDLVRNNATGSVYSGIEKNDVYRRFLKLQLDEQCITCNFLPICQGGCPVEANHASLSNSKCIKFKYKIDGIAKLLSEYYV